MTFPTLPPPGDLPAIGINIDGVLEHDGLPTPDAATRFAWIRACGAFDYIEKNIDPSEDFAPWFDLVERHGVPIGVFGGIFRAGADEALMRQGLATGGRLGARLFNIQLHDRHADGHRLSDEEVVRFYADAFEHGQRSGCLPSLEVHVDMWNERFHRVEAVAERLARQGLPLRLTLDHSHLIFKIDDPAELALSEIDGGRDGGRTWLAPDGAQCLWRRWLAEGWVVHAHARSVATGRGPNPLTRRRDGRPGRSIQYPFVRPEAGTFPGVWQEERLAVWKQAVLDLLAWMRAHPERAPRQISCEFIPFPDYGGGLRCSIMDSNLACADWLRAQWAATAGGAGPQPA
ncbi:hypothetical protein X805_33280 [Sphaerotilus natans subsp. natans DSM 6575]|uniref:Xylose isomerase n=1 Tax=Sphaerotilus natans subsp. natans DSM 6575 TaxID=1286631 RepID=A0A059KI38_9BURK|nr:hypothetical protein [Sphaerotilus natans]KDB51101.1 hypothetical protein X805_33280 [Sphaerotilus natans subsp. natans DSM 6575]SIS01835.1 hypothetical protein SAMN05421778_12842 [Sphaerotilus natans]